MCIRDSEYSDVIVIQESESAEIAADYSESVSISESQLSEIASVYAEQIDLIEGFNSQIPVSCSETLSITEQAPLSSLEYSVVESIGFSESLASVYEMSYSDIVSIIETVATKYYYATVCISLHCDLQKPKIVTLSCPLEKPKIITLNCKLVCLLP